jgi:ABC-type branched-subunit amino acid transport system ATPase component/ABC-type branched-subunit amino acid transport system permease subunit
MRTTNLTKAIVVAALVALALVPLFHVNTFWIFFITVTITQTMLLASLNLTLGYGGLISLGHNALFAIGGYATAYFTTVRGIPVGAGIALGMAFGALAGFLLALPAVRARAVYFGIITLSFLFLTSQTVSNWRALGGFLGIPSVPGLSIAGHHFDANDYYWFALAVFVLMMGMLQQLSVSAVGRTFIAIRENEAAAASLGINVFTTKILNLVLSGMLAGLAGALAAHLTGGVFPEAASFVSGFRLFVAIVFGGVGTFAGPLLGMAVVATVDRFTVNWTTAQPILFGLMLIGSLAVMRLGLVGTILTSRFGRWFLKIPQLDLEENADVPAAPPRIGKPGDPILRVSGMSKHFDGVQALADVDLSVAAGSIHGLIGPNGSGKTTFVNCLTGYVRRDAGRIEWDGAGIDKPRPHAMARMGVVRIFQRAEEFGRLLVVQNVIMGLHLQSDRNLFRCAVPWPKRRRAERALITDALRILSEVGLAHRALTPIRDLPCGERRLVEIARAVAARPRLLVLDEPATGLTAVELVRLRSLLLQLKAAGLTILVIEHNMDFLMDLVDRITVLESGRCIAVGEPLKIQRDPAVVEAYLGERIPA